ncbi:MAG TPA: Asp-tRNA(Asn)/Glu-tRNA(Gln) amidotransferase subunit GatC [Chloroflexota bacterium]
MTIPRDVVTYVAGLAHVGLSADEVDELATELSSVLEHIAVLQGVNVEGVLPTSHVAQVTNVLRDDEVRPSWPAEAVLSNAPRREDNLFAVSGIFD